MTASSDVATKRPGRPWVVVAPGALHYVGVHADEADAWRVSLGWPDEAEIAAYKKAGWYAAPATVAWDKPKGSP